MEHFDFVSVPVIVGAVFGALTLLKKAVKCKEKVMKFLPVIAAALGAVFGVIAFFAVPEIIPASNAFVAVLVGASSGLAATGTHQAFKQLLTKLPPKLAEKLNDKLTELIKGKEDKRDDSSGK